VPVKGRLCGRRFGNDSVNADRTHAFPVEKASRRVKDAFSGRCRRRRVRKCHGLNVILAQRQTDKTVPKTGTKYTREAVVALPDEMNAHAYETSGIPGEFVAVYILTALRMPLPTCAGLHNNAQG